VLRFLSVLFCSSALLGACGGEGDVITSGSESNISSSITTSTVRIEDNGINRYYFAESNENYRISGSNNTIYIGGTANEVKVTGDNNRVEVYNSPVDEIDITGNDNSILARSNADVEDRGAGNQVERY